jgi:ribosome-associated protein
VRKTSSVTDYIVLVSGSSPPHLKALFSEALHVLKQEGVACYRHVGGSDGVWLVLDFVDVVIHILSPEARRYYAIEELWPKAPRLSWSPPRRR